MPRTGKARAGGAWGDNLRDRLRLVLKEKNLSQAQLANLCDTVPPRVTEWLAGKNLPSAETLRRVGESPALSLSVDWLLFGEGGPGPVYRGQSRSRADLAADVLAFIKHELPTGRLGADLPQRFLDGLDGKKLLDELLSAQYTHAQLWRAVDSALLAEDRSKLGRPMSRSRGPRFDR